MLETNYEGAEEYEKFLRERMALKKKKQAKVDYLGYWHFTDEKLIELKLKYESELSANPKIEWKLKKVYEEIIKRGL